MPEARYPEGLFQYQHWQAIVLRCHCDLYEGMPDAARDRLADKMKTIRGSPIASAGGSAVELARLQGALDVALCDPGRHFSVLKSIERLVRLGRPDAAGCAALFRAATAYQRGDASTTLDELDEAIAYFEQASAKLDLACARRRKGELLGGDAGRLLIDAADEVMTREEIRSPERWCAIHAPGFDQPGL
jgi:hypothetical protein